MRFVRLSQEEIDTVRRLYEGVMSYASHGLFFREGAALADALLDAAGEGDDPFETVRSALVERGWVEAIELGEDEVRVTGSIEASPGGSAPTCHRLRGIVSRLVELRTGSKARYAEVACASTGAEACVFQPEPEG